jgi:hypothetical protein
MDAVHLTYNKSKGRVDGRREAYFEPCTNVTLDTNQQVSMWIDEAGMRKPSHSN